MRPTLAVALATAALVATWAHPVSADTAAELMKRGVAAFKAGKYADAATALKGAYDLDQKPETLFALAQAERLGGDCPTAAAHYHQVLEQLSDLDVAKLVEQNLRLCEKDAPPPPPHDTPAPPPAAPPPAPPPPVVKTVIRVREVSRTDKLTAGMFAGGTLALGASVGLFVAASANRDAADAAATRDDYDTFDHRAGVERGAMFVAAGAGVAMIGYATFRWLHAAPTPVDVAVIPTATGGTFVVGSRW